ncbi:hypothetical protein H2359_003524 [Salmonella enterica]|uniref:hypothetical protein n=1 Tax=Enterobacteriaceae TaxID=543 RepID=UPI00142B7640|nr:hypothetical protein [Citrobacter sp. Cpo090]EAY3776759.1 hypothetical protein [Salmonella enterica]ECK0358985.1 hypothetical protein [Salmonella enterica subsp. enterica serovar Urbana]EAZ5520013.1 hypothetical protein [Salmonella enterica]EBB1669532.1 hypothetical protein [Salmonella enterica]EBB5705865.1 hypothetical protein [Salmonella enterica]
MVDKAIFSSINGITHSTNNSFIPLMDVFIPTYSGYNPHYTAICSGSRPLMEHYNIDTWNKWSLATPKIKHSLCSHLILEITNNQTLRFSRYRIENPQASFSRFRSIQ